MNSDTIFNAEEVIGVPLMEIQPGKLEDRSGRIRLSFKNDSLITAMVDGRIYMPGNDQDRGLKIAKLAYDRPLDTLEEIEMAYRESLNGIPPFNINAPEKGDPELHKAMELISMADTSSGEAWAETARAVSDLNIDFNKGRAEYMRAGRNRKELLEALKTGEPGAGLWFVRAWTAGPAFRAQELDKWAKQENICEKWLENNEPVQRGMPTVAITDYPEPEILDGPPLPDIIEPDPKGPPIPDIANSGQYRVPDGPPIPPMGNMELIPGPDISSREPDLYEMDFGRMLAMAKSVPDPVQDDPEPKRGAMPREVIR